MTNQTFGIPVDATQNLMVAAQEKIEIFKSFQSSTDYEIKYLESEISAVSSFVEYHKLQDERERDICKFSSNNEYGSSLQTPDRMLDSAKERLVELESRLASYVIRNNDLKRKISFLENDIDLLKSMLKSSPRTKMSEMSVPPPV